MKKAISRDISSILIIFFFVCSIFNLQCEFGNKSEDNSKDITSEITSPVDGELLPGCIAYHVITVNAEPVEMVDKVEVYVNDILIGTDTVSPYEFPWNPHDFMPEPDPLAYLLSLLDETPALQKIFENMPPEILNWILNQLIQRSPKFQELMAAKDKIRIKSIAYDMDGKTMTDEVLVEAEESDYTCSCYSKIVTCFENVSKKNPVKRCFDLAAYCCQECGSTTECCYSQCLKTKTDALEACSTVFADDPDNMNACITEAGLFNCDTVCTIKK